MTSTTDKSKSTVPSEFQTAPETKEEPEPADDEPAPAVDLDLSTVRNRWEEVVNLVKEQKVSVGTFLSQGSPRSLDDNQLLVMFKRHRDFHKKQVERNKESVEAVLKGVFGVEVRIVCDVDYDDVPQEIAQEQMTLLIPHP